LFSLGRTLIAHASQQAQSKDNVNVLAQAAINVADIFPTK